MISLRASRHALREQEFTQGLARATHPLADDRRPVVALALRHLLVGALRGETPPDVARTEAGARVIETILAKIDWGAAA